MVAETALHRVSHLLARCAGSHSVLPPTALFNEGWLLRLVLDGLEQCEPATLTAQASHALGFLPGAHWYSEALLASRFLPRHRADPLAESFTHADGLIGHFDIAPGLRGEATVATGATQLVVIEAKLGAGLSSGVTNAPGYDQAARSAACIAHMLAVAKRTPARFDRLGLCVLAPAARIDGGAFGDLVTKPSIAAKVARRVAAYGGVHDAWYEAWLEPTLTALWVTLLSWESVLDHLEAAQPDSPQVHAGLRAFYAECLRWNRLAP
ncbi:hypothetical protein CKO31_13430 [Thiohalocapsa halophila]|uniref:Uncharacterized protein n=1 Tax=Thiohalocapsa halophila TaxID=69359 RepID=A0ABS1CIJ2_9GAMM|nr:hypothetical protein [Thiohalocapsa halophila]MBK1631729.1 hypothetical protein [Thiohalocapsa halophila]